MDYGLNVQDMLQTLRIYWLQRTRSNELGPSYKQFYGSDWPGVEFLHQFGEMGVVKTARKIQNKLENKGTTLIYCGRAANHGADVHQTDILERCMDNCVI